MTDQQWWDPMPPCELFYEKCWQLVGPSGRPVICDIREVSHGYETRASYDGADDIIATHFSADVRLARTKADLCWKELLAKGFTESGKEDV